MSYTHAAALENEHVELHPLSADHHDDLVAAVVDGDLWRTWFARIPSPNGMAAEIERRLSRHADGPIAPWAIINPVSGRAVGMTTYLNPDCANRRLEIGSTWIGRHAQGTLINPAAKLLLLERAFDALGWIAVEFRTHWHNHQSGAAIARLGAKQDGILRNHVIMENGTIRDTVVFSILDSEWPTVRYGLTERLAQPGHRTQRASGA